MGNEASYVMCILAVCVRAAWFREKRCLVRKWENFLFFLEFLYFPEACLLVILWKGSIELNGSRVTSSTEVWQMPYLLVSLYSWQATHMHACIDTYIHTHTHTSLLISRHACMHTHGAGGWLSLHVSVCGLTTTKPCVQMNTIKDHFVPKHVYSWAQLVLDLKCIPFVLSAK